MGGKLTETILRTHKALQALTQEPMNIQQLARELALNYPATLRLVNALEETGLITKQIDPGPPRQIILTLTPLGQCIAKCLTQHNHPLTQLQRTHQTPTEYRLYHSTDEA